jgi:hypothetical protein
MSWSSSTDNVKVEKYEVRRNGTLLDSVAHENKPVHFFITKDIVIPCTFEVRALDAEGNFSDSDPLQLP